MISATRGVSAVRLWDPLLGLDGCVAIGAVVLELHPTRRATDRRIDRFMVRLLGASLR